MTLNIHCQDYTHSSSSTNISPNLDDTQTGNSNINQHIVTTTNNTYDEGISSAYEVTRSYNIISSSYIPSWKITEFLDGVDNAITPNNSAEHQANRLSLAKVRSIESKVKVLCSKKKVLCPINLPSDVTGNLMKSQGASINTVDGANQDQFELISSRDQSLKFWE